MDPEKNDSSQHEIVPAAVEPAEKHDTDPDHLGETKGLAKEPLLLDKAGLALIPQPTSHKDDPLVRRWTYIDHQVQH
jgi:hypothetical protein